MVSGWINGSLITEFSSKMLAKRNTEENLALGKIH